MEKSSAARLLTSVDSLFTTQEERDVAKQPRVQEIPIDQIDDFPNHPFKVRMDENMEQTAESVKQYGVLVPAIVRPKEDGRYEMVSGHRRKMACSLIARQSMPCIVRDLTDEEATIEVGCYKTAGKTQRFNFIANGDKVGYGYHARPAEWRKQRSGVSIYQIDEPYSRNSRVG